MRKLEEVIISITQRCNLKCRMCDIPLRRKEELSTGVWKQVIHDARRLGARTIVFSGGEPLLRDDICELIAFTKDKHMKACLTSNGIALDRLCAGLLRRAGVDAVNISIDGPRGIHDFLRGEGAFNKAVDAVKALVAERIDTTIATFISSYNFRHLNYIVSLARTCDVGAVKLQPFNPLFVNTQSVGGFPDDFYIRPEEEKLFEQIIEDSIRYCASNGIALNPLSYLRKIPSYLCRTMNVTPGVCGSLWHSCSLYAWGGVYPCWVLSQDDMSLGDVNVSGLYEIWHSKRRASVIQAIKDRNCPGCLMSCYDHNMGVDTFEEKVSRNIRALHTQGFVRMLKSRSQRWMGRLSFYAAYRGSAAAFIRRVKGFFKKKRYFKEGEALLNDKDARLREVARAKTMIMDEMGRK